VCFLVQNIAVNFVYQKHVHFRNGHIVLGFEFLGRGQMSQGTSKKCKSIGVCIYFTNNDVGLWKLSDVWCTYRYMYMYVVKVVNILS
jgi:hypothetical protein